MTQAQGIGPIAELLRNLQTRVRESLNIQYSKADQFPPGFNAEKLTTVNAIKEWALAGRAACNQLSKGIETGKASTKVVLSSDQDALDHVARQFGRVETAASQGLEAATAAVQEFNEWKDITGYLSWARFVELQGPVSKHAREVVGAQKKVKTYNDCSARASSIAVTLRNQHPHGPNSVVGTVIAGLVDSISNQSWVGTSGPPKSHQVMDQLLSGVAQVEKWPVNVCGEVDAMIQYLNAQQIKKVEEIPPGALFSHAETWDDTEGKWKGRSACGNCGTWLDRIGANRA